MLCTSVSINSQYEQHIGSLIVKLRECLNVYILSNEATLIYHSTFLGLVYNFPQRIKLRNEQQVSPPFPVEASYADKGLDTI